MEKTKKINGKMGSGKGSNSIAIPETASLEVPPQVLFHSKLFILILDWKDVVVCLSAGKEKLIKIVKNVIKLNKRDNCKINFFFLISVI